MEDIKLVEKRYPHLKNHILNFNDTGEKKSLSIKIDSEVQYYLKDHIFGGESFVPATMIIEILFEATLYYCEYYLKIDVENIKPIKLEEFDILRSLKMKPGDAINAEIRFNSVKIEKKGIFSDITIYSNRLNSQKEIIGRRVNVISKVQMGVEPYEPVKFIIPKEHFNYYQLNKKEFYSLYFPSLGYLFQTSLARFAVNDAKTCYVAEYNCNDNEKRFIQNQESEFLTSPLGNDSCLQAAVFFSRMINLIGRLPIGGEELYFYRDHPPEATMHVFIEKVEIDTDMKCNIYSYDEDGIIFYAKNFVVRKSPYHKLMDRDAFETNIGEHKIEPFKL